ncbi:MAG: TM0996/MTH895 family glutaredoxin-like protein [Thermoleophilia bacterium]|nr:TM0996/MTH895 family glutaredoxin-like protein [Thermoleophilia bacterium]
MISIKVLGAQCSNCEKLFEAVKQAVQSLGVEANLEKVTDYQEMMHYGLMQTPGLVIEEKLVAAGRIPPMSELVSMITTALAAQG